ncbi:MAG: hypothetical protein Q7R96_01085 [Nanoarchaeota archaeon]|nr:hypothetical protein [Nanoarchaeota archaeon]
MGLITGHKIVTAHELYTLQLKVGDTTFSTPQPIEGREKTWEAIIALQHLVILHQTVRNHLTILLDTQWRTAEGAYSYDQRLPNPVYKQKITLETLAENIEKKKPLTTFELPIVESNYRT